MDIDDGLLSEKLALAVELLADVFAARSVRHALIGAVSFRPQDQMDIETLLTANRDTIDVQQIRDEWSPFADTEAERTAWLEATIARRVVRRE